MSVIESTDSQGSEHDVDFQRVPMTEFEWSVYEILLNGGLGVGWDYWIEKIPKWTAREAACLSFGVDPRFWEEPERAVNANVDKGFRDVGVHRSAYLMSEIEDLFKVLDMRLDGLHQPNEWVKLLTALGCNLPPKMAGLVGGDSETAKNGSSRGVTVATKERSVVLERLISDVESKAQAAGIPFARDRWPGTKEEFRAFAVCFDTALYALPSSNDRLSDVLAPHGVKMLRGNNKGKGHAFYCRLYPDYLGRD